MVFYDKQLLSVYYLNLCSISLPARNTRHIATAHTAHFTLNSIAPTL